MGAIWAEVKENRPVGEDVFRLALNAAAITAKARPGQFVMLRVAHGNDPLLARPFSIHGAAGDELLILYKVVGRGTRILSQVRPGKTLQLWGPLGRGFDLSGDKPLLVAGGMGLAPLAFAARWLRDHGRKAGFCAGLPGLAGWEELTRGLEAELAGSVALAWSSEDGSLGRRGLVTELLAEVLKAANGSSGGVLACGPMPMLKAVAKVCDQHGVACQVSLEAPMACGLGACLGCAIPAAGGGYLRACQEGPVLAAAAVDWERI